MFIGEVTIEETEEFHRNISKTVRNLRIERELTQLDVSLQLGFNNPTFITNAESFNSSKKFNLTQLHKLSIIFDIGMCEFFKKD